MSRHSIKRPLRLLPGAAESDAPAPPAGNAETTADTADYFRRILLGERDAKPAAAHRRDLAVLGLETAAGPQATPGAQHAGETPGAVAPPAAAAPAAARPVAERPDAGESPVQRRPASPLPWHNDDLPGRQAQDRWSERMALLVGDLCKRADPAFKSWTATLRIDPEVLPDTQLRLSLSPHWLSLRFITGSQEAGRLVSTHRPELQSLLERAPNLPHGIDIDIA